MDRRENVTNAQAAPPADLPSQMELNYRPPLPVTRVGGKLLYQPSNLDILERRLHVLIPGRADEERIWHDDLVRDFQAHRMPALEDAAVIPFGENLIWSLVEGYVVGLGHVVTALALNLRKRNGARIILPEDCAGENADNVLTEAVNNQQLAIMNVAIGRLRDQNAKKRGTNKYGADIPTASDLISKLRRMSMRIQASFYCFTAAVATRICVKDRATVLRHLENIPEKFAQFYDLDDVNIEMPRLALKTLESLAICLAAGRSLARSIITAAVAAKIRNRDRQEVCGILDFTILLHTSYNGMQMIPLTLKAKEIMGVGDVEAVLQDFESDATRASGRRIVRFFDCYAAGNNHHGAGFYAPWSRILDNRFWSSLSIRKNSTLGHLLMAVCEEKNPDIFQMKGLPADPELKRMARSVITVVSRPGCFDSSRPGRASYCPIWSPGPKASDSKEASGNGSPSLSSSSNPPEDENANLDAINDPVLKTFHF